MTIWLPDLSQTSGPRYLALADALADAIRGGELPIGSRLPPQRELAWQLGVTVGTVGRAYAIAEQRGLVSGEVGRGTYVRAGVGGAAAAPQPSDAPVDLARNVPASGAAEAALAATLNRLAKEPQLGRLLSYAPDAGHAEHRRAGAAWIGRTGWQPDPERIVVTSGAQQAMAVTVATLTGNGERILTEELTYCGLIDLSRVLQRRLEGVALDDQGLRPDALDAACRRGPARVVCITPTIHNPTAATMSLARRQQIVEVARRHDLLVIEDDVYGHLPPERPVPIAALAPERTVYVASASKCLATGLRVAWIAALPELTGRFAETLNALAITAPALPAAVVADWIGDGTAERLTELRREECVARQHIASEVFAGFEMRSDPYSYHLLLTLPAPWRAQEFAAAARRLGVAVVPAGTFAVGQAEAPHAVRVSLAAAPDRIVLRQALERLAGLALASPGARRAVI